MNAVHNRPAVHVSSTSRRGTTGTGDRSRPCSRCQPRTCRNSCAPTASRRSGKRSKSAASAVRASTRASGIESGGGVGRDDGVACRDGDIADLEIAHREPQGEGGELLAGVLAAVGDECGQHRPDLLLHERGVLGRRVGGVHDGRDEPRGVVHQLVRDAEEFADDPQSMLTTPIQPSTQPQEGCSPSSGHNLQCSRGSSAL